MAAAARGFVRKFEFSFARLCRVGSERGGLNFGGVFFLVAVDLPRPKQFNVVSKI